MPLIPLAWLPLLAAWVLPWLGALAPDPAAWLARERLGPFALGQPEAEARAHLPCPSTTTPFEEWGADGQWHGQIVAPACGVTLGLVAPTKTGPRTVEAVTVQAPATLASSRGVGVGTPEAEAARAYRAELDPEATRPGEHLVAGSVYGGLLLDVEAGKVVRLFLGAAAE